MARYFFIPVFLLALAFAAPASANKSADDGGAVVQAGGLSCFSIRPSDSPAKPETKHLTALYRSCDELCAAKGAACTATTGNRNPPVSCAAPIDDRHATLCRRTLGGAAFALALSLGASPASAQVDGEHQTPGSACPSGAVAGHAVQPDWDTFFECNGSNQWQRGPYFFGASSDTCDASHEGLTRYDSTAHGLYFCNGTTWQAVNAAGAGGITPGCGASGTLSTQQQTTINVAAGCTVQFKVWGGGGGGGTTWPTGGGGGYATITLGPLGSATTYYLVVGGGGTTDGSGGAGLAGYTGGSQGGGAASGVWTGSYGGTPVVVAGGGGGEGGQDSDGGNSAGFAGGVTTYDGTALQSSGVTAGGDNPYGGGGAGYPNGGLASPVYGYWSGGGGSNYAATGGSTAAGSNANPGNAGDANRPANAGQGSPGSYVNGYDGAIYYSTY